MIPSASQWGLVVYKNGTPIGYVKDEQFHVIPKSQRAPFQERLSDSEKEFLSQKYRSRLSVTG